MRIWFFILAGIAGALIGYNLSFFLIDLIKYIFKTTTQSPISFNVEFILFPIVASCLSVALILTSIYLSNPIHYKANQRIRKDYLKRAFLTGILTGFLSAIITIIIDQLKWPAESIRVIGWSLIGFGTGLAEGFCWYSLSVEGAKSTDKIRLIKSSFFGLAAGLIAGVTIELLRKAIPLGGYEDLLGFILLGTCLAVALIFSTTPTYQVALRAGRGFGAINLKTEKESNQPKRPYPKIQNSSLSLVYFPDTNRIEEGLSIQLPVKRNLSILIGSSEEADIFLPDVPAKAAKLTLEQQQWKLICLSNRKVQVQRRLLLENGQSTPLSHNQILTFYHENNPQKFYRFIFYDRFLAPNN